MEDQFKITLENVVNLQDRVGSLLSQGIFMASCEELEAIIPQLSALGLQQPALLIKQVQQNIEQKTVGKNAIESLIKVLQVLYQTEMLLSKADTVEVKNLIQVNNSVYVDSDKSEMGFKTQLNDILYIPNRFVKVRQLIEYLKNADYEELEQSIENIWFDYSLSFCVAEGLKERPEYALNLARKAFSYNNMVMKITAIRVVEEIGKNESWKNKAIEILAEFFKQSKEPIMDFIVEAEEKITGISSSYLESRKNCLKYQEKNIKELGSLAKGKRFATIKVLSESKNPYFTNALAGLLNHEDDKTVKAAIHGLIEIGGIEAISRMKQMLGGPHNNPIMEALSRFGDRSVPAFIFKNIDSKALPASYRDALQTYGTLAFNMLIDTISRCDSPVNYKNAFSSIFITLRSDALAQRLISEAKKSEFAEKLSALISSMFPQYIKKIGIKTKKYEFSEIEPFVSSIFGGITIEKRGCYDFIITPDGKYLIVLNRGIGVEILSTTDWQYKDKLNIEGYPLNISISCDGRYVFTLKHLKSRYVIEVWEFGKWSSSIASINWQIEAKSIASTSDGRHIVIGSDKGVTVITFGKWDEMFELPLPADNSRSYYGRGTYIKSIPAKKCVLTGDWSGKLWVWDETTWKNIAELKADSWAPRFAAVSYDGNYLVYAGVIGIKIWETQEWKEIASLKGPKEVNYTAITPDGKHLVISSAKKLRFLEFGTWKETISLEADTPLSPVVITPDQKQIIARKNNQITIWRLKNFEL